MYGVQQLKDFNEKEYKDFISSLKEKNNFFSIISDTNQYKNIIKLGRNPKEKNDFGQPVQILYFENNTIKSYHANCYVQGSLTNLNWNTDERFSAFIPKSAVPIDSLKINLNDYIKIYPNITSQKGEKYTVLIFWTLMLEKISNSAIETVFFNLKQFNKKSETSVILINSDKYFSTIK